MEHQDGSARIRPGSINGETKLANVPSLGLYFHDCPAATTLPVQNSIR